MANEGPVDPRVADRYLGLIMDGSTLSESEWQEALWAYRQLLAATGTSRNQEERRVVRRRVAQIALVMPDDTVRRLLSGGVLEDPSTWRFRSNAGTTLLRWWRTQDPVLKTSRNERLEEHLERLAYASARYRYEETVTNLDDRGDTYVRFGRPLRVERLKFNEFEFHDEVFRFGVPVSQSDFPANEVWGYHNIDESGYYIFVRTADEAYQFANARDLIPPRLRHVSGRTDRQLNIAVSGLAAMRYVYKELASMQGVYGPYYTRINNYILRQEEQQIQRSLGMRGGSGQLRIVGEGRTARGVASNPASGLQPPTTQLQETLTATAQAEHRAEKRREERMPLAYTSVLNDVEELPVAVRTARFLNENGMTDLEVYWAPSFGALQITESVRERFDDTGYDPDGSYLLNFTGLPYDRTFRPGTPTREQYLVDREGSGGRSVYAPKTHRFSGRQSLFHVHLQWVQQSVDVRSGEREVGPRVKESLVQFDSLRALNPDTSTLEMSDLRLMSTFGSDAERLTLETAVPHPFPMLKSKRPLLLYFELYHLKYDENNRTNYSIEYEVRRHTEEGTLGGLLRTEELTRTATETSYSSGNRNTEEYIVLDWGQKNVKEAETVTIHVRATDEVRQQQISRQVKLRLVPSHVEN